MSEIQKYVILITTAFLIYVVFNTIYRVLRINKQFPKFDLNDEEIVKELSAQLGLQSEDKDSIDIKQITKALNDKKKSLIIDEIRLELIKIVLGIAIIVITCLNIL
jgi:hypothetical protein